MEVFEQNVVEEKQKILVRDLRSRYGREKTNIYNKMKALGIKPFKEDRSSYIRPEELQLMDDLHLYLTEQKGTVRDFVQACIESGRIIQKQSVLEPDSEPEQPESKAIVLHESQTSTLAQREKTEHLEVDQPSCEISSHSDEYVTVAELSEQNLDTQDLSEVDLQAQERAFQKAIALEIVTLILTDKSTTPGMREQLEEYRQKCDRAIDVGSSNRINDHFSLDGICSECEKLVKLGEMKHRDRQILILVLIAIASMLAIVLLPTRTVIFLIVSILVMNNWAVLKNAFQQWNKKRQQRIKLPEDNASVPMNAPDTRITTEPQTYTPRRYRNSEFNRIIASLRADAGILVVGEAGSGKTFLANDVATALKNEGFEVVFIDARTHKQILIEIAYQLDISRTDINGKHFSLQELEIEIAFYLQHHTAFLIVDDAQRCTPKFRKWLKDICRKKPMLLLAINPPKTDVFINLPRLELLPLPEYAIREMLEQASLERGLNLTANDLARLQERTSGNPMFALRAVDEEYIGVDTEAGDHSRYFDMTPLILLVGVGFTIVRFITLGSTNPALYILAGSSGALFTAVSYALRSIPKESQRF